MKKLFQILLPCLTGVSLFSQNFLLDVSNGFGSGSFPAGDSAHVFSEKPPAASVFHHWMGDTAALENPGGWNSLVVMPAQNVSVSPVFRPLPPNPQPVFEEIMGRDTLKAVWRWFPAGGSPKGTVWLMHGTGGMAKGWAEGFEKRNFLDACIADGFAVVATESEETTRNTDLTGDGKIRWQPYPADSLANVDYANIRAIRDTFIGRGWMSAATPQFAVGMSNGGSFSITFGTVMGWQGIVSYCAPGADLIAELTQTPTMWCMAKFDDNENVGAQGNADALGNHQIMLARGICSRYFLHDRTPLLPQRFERSGQLSAAQAQAVFDDLQANGVLDTKNRLEISVDSLATLILANPQNWLGIALLSPAQRGFVSEQLDVARADHEFFGDYNLRTLGFLNHACATPVGATEHFEKSSFEIFPNPAAASFTLRSGRAGRYLIFNAFGQPVSSGDFPAGGREVSVSGFPPGLFFVQISTGTGQTVLRLVKNGSGD
jgi:hypothetical protein